jgi:hypothetical protein
MSTTPPRPTIDAITAWRIQQVADAEHRSLANATHVLIEEAWNARITAMVAKAGFPPKARSNTPRGDARS